MKNRIQESIRRAIRRKSRPGKRVVDDHRRPLNAERLEGRLLLAADFQNPINPYDVNVDNKVSPSDLISLFTDLRNNGARYLTASRGAEGEPGSSNASAGKPLMVDVNGDNRVNVQDAIRVLTKLGEGAPGDPQARFRAYVTNTNNQAITSVSVGQTVLVKLTVQDIRDPSDSRFPDLQGSQARKGLTQAFTDLVFSLNASVQVNHFQTPAPPHTFEHFAPYTLFTSGSNNGTPYPLLGVGIIEDLGGNQNFTFDNQGNVIFDPLGPGEFDLVQMAFRINSGNPKAVGEALNVDEGSQNNLLNVLANDTVDGNFRIQGKFADGDSNPVATYFSAPDINSLIVPESEILYPTVQLPINGISLGGLTVISTTSGTAVVDNNGTPNVGNDDRIRFTPAPGFTGIVQIVYRISDGQNATATATATVSVGPVNDPPVNTVPGPQNINEDTVLTLAGANRISISDPDAGAANVQVNMNVQNGRLNLTSTTNLTVTGQNTPGLQVVGTIADINAALGGNSLTYTPNLNFNGQDNLVVITNDLGNTGDGGPQTDTDTVAITVNPINDAPINVVPGTQFIVEDEVLVNNDGAGNPLVFTTDVDAGAAEIDVKISVSTNDGPNPGTLALGSTQGITLIAGANNSPSATIRGSQAAIKAALLNATYTPAPGFIGNVTLNIMTDDRGNTGAGGPLTDNDNVTITVESAVVPRARNKRETVAEDSSNNEFNVLANAIVTPPATTKATLESFTQGVNGGTVTRKDNGTPNDLTDDRVFYTPAPNFFGTDTFTYTINDTVGTGLDNTATVTVTVTEVNDGPTANGDAVVTNEDIPLDIAAATLTGNDSKGPANESGQILTITAVGGGSSTTTANGATVSLNNGNVRYQPALNFNGTDTFTYTIQDNGTTNGQPDFKSSTATVTVTVRSVNDAPVANNDSAGSVDEDTNLQIPFATLLGNDTRGGGTDENGQTLTIINVSSASGATVSLNGVVNYKAAPDFFGTDTFTYTIRDNGQSNGVDDFKTATGTVTVTVNPLNDAPIVVNDNATGIKNFRTEHKGSDLLANDKPGPANESSQTLSISRVVGTTQQGGTLELINQSLFYTPPADYLGPDVGTYFVMDNGPSDGVKQFNETQALIIFDVIDFIPSPFSGFVYLDVDNNGLKGAQERGIGGVKVDLINTATNDVVATQRTDATGFYQFTLTMPGTYKIHEHSPHLIMDGQERIGSYGGTVGDDSYTFTVNLPGGVSGTNYNFGERGLDANHFTIYEILASRGTSSANNTNGNGLLVGGNPNSTDFWYVVLGGWNNLVNARAAFNGNDSMVDAIITDHVQTRTRNLTIDGNRLRLMGHDPAGGRVLRFDGAATDFGFTLASHDGEGEGAALDEGQTGDAYRQDVDALMAESAWA